MLCYNIALVVNVADINTSVKADAHISVKADVSTNANISVSIAIKALCDNITLLILFIDKIYYRFSDDRL